MLKTAKKILKYLFKTKITIYRWQFNLVVLLAVGGGLILGTYLTLTKFWPNTKALNDTIQTWMFDAASASNYTYNANLSVDNSGAQLFGYGSGADGAITVSTTKTLDTNNIANGRIYADAVNFNIPTLLSAGANTINLGATPNGLVVNDEVLIINLRDQNNTDSTTYGYVVSGTATAGSSTTLQDTSKIWTTNAYSNMTIGITSGTGVGQSRVIASNSSNTITVATSWTTSPDSTSTY